MGKKLRCAVAGLGLGQAWTNMISAAPDFELAGLIDVDEARLNQVADKLELPKGARFTDFDKALAGLRELDTDVIVVVTPPVLHKQNVLGALDAGYHVLSEKPLAENMEEARAMATAIRVTSQKSGRKYMVSQNYRWTDSVATVRDAIAEGLIGEVGYVTLAFNKAIRFGGWREQLPEVLLEDMSIHHFDLLRHLTGKNCERLYARTFHPKWSWFGGNPGASVVMQMEGGVEVSYFGSWVSRGKETSWPGEWRIVGDKGAIHWDSPESSLVIGHPEDVPRAPELETKALPERKLPHSGFEYSLYEFGAAIAENREPVTGIDDNIQSFAIAMAAIESARTGQPIDMKSYIG